MFCKLTLTRSLTIKFICLIIMQILNQEFVIMLLHNRIIFLQLAPQLSLQEEFVYNWKAVTTYFIENKGI